MRLWKRRAERRQITPWDISRACLGQIVMLSQVVVGESVETASEPNEFTALIEPVEVLAGEVVAIQVSGAQYPTLSNDVEHLIDMKNRTWPC